MPVVSIVVPVYNKAAFLPRCLDSILAQSFRDFELILAEDGSTDGSLEICRRYQKQDPRIRLLELPHGGVSAVRNAGIEAAAGEYLQFVDADDILLPAAAEFLIDAMHRDTADWVIGSFLVEGLRETDSGGFDGCRNREEMATHFLQYIESLYYGVVWNKLYRLDWIRSSGMRFDPAVAWSEDLLFNLQYAQMCQCVRYCSRPVYHQMQHCDMKRYRSLVDIPDILCRRAKAAGAFQQTMLPGNRQAMRNVDILCWTSAYSQMAVQFRESGRSGVAACCKQLAPLLSNTGIVFPNGRIGPVTLFAALYRTGLPALLGWYFTIRSALKGEEG